MVCADPVPDQCRHLPHWEQIQQKPDGEYDLLVSLDCSDLERWGKVYDPQRFVDLAIVNIDHHTTNVNFGAINWVEPSAAATTQMLVWLLQEMDLALDVEVATCLLNGIVTDTLGFRTSSTDSQVMATAIELMDAGASLSELTQRIFNHRPMATIRMWAQALQRLHLQDRIVWSEITQEMRLCIGYHESGDAGLVNFINTADVADIAVIFDELDDGQVNVSMRAVPGYDVSRVALQLGGGGHPQAAGCTLKGSLLDVQSKVLSLLQQAWQTQSQDR
jgi:phosphoesterase RecJ-like protein